LHRFDPTPEAILALPALFSRVPNPAIFTRMTHLWHADVVALKKVTYDYQKILEQLALQKTQMSNWQSALEALVDEIGTQRIAQGADSRATTQEEIATLRDELRAAKEAEAQLHEEIGKQLLAMASTWRVTAFVRAHLAAHPSMATHVRRAAKVLWWGAYKLRARRASLRQGRAIASFVPAAPATKEPPASVPVAAEPQGVEPWPEALPMVSVILSEAIPEATRDTLLNQLTTTAPRHELLVIADGSDRLPFDHPSLRHYVRPAGVGDDADGDFALKRAFGKYVCFLKPADRLSDDYLSSAIDKLEQSGADYAVCRRSSLLVEPASDEFALPPIFRRSALDRLSASSNFGSHETRRSSFAAPLAATEFSSSAASAG
jgi:hypothetical protein